MLSVGGSETGVLGRLPCSQFTGGSESEEEDEVKRRDSGGKRQHF